MADVVRRRERPVDIAQLLWGRPATTPARGPKPSLTVDVIARASVEIADAEGLAALSMQRVGEALGVTKMALYRYVASKAELLAVTIEAAVGDPPIPTTEPVDWRLRIEDWARQLRARWQQHPWLPGATVGERVMGPNEVSWIETALDALGGSGLDGHERMDVVVILCGHVRQMATLSGTQPWIPNNELRPTLQRHLEERKECFPALLAAVHAQASPESGWSFGLRLLLNGVEGHVAERGHSTGIPNAGDSGTELPTAASSPAASTSPASPPTALGG